MEKIFLVDCAPRFDVSRNDPFGLKPKLAKYNNTIQMDLVKNSPAKEKIMIGNHILNFNDDSFGNPADPVLMVYICKGVLVRLNIPAV